jgi:hypothetical protein
MQARRRHLLYSALIALVVFALSGCTAAIPAAEAPATEAAAEAPAAEVPAGLEELVAAAQAEGELTTIALPRDWCNYGEMIDASPPSTASRSTSLTRTPAPATSWRRSRPTRTTSARRRPT